MGRKISHINWRIQVEPETPPYRSIIEKDWRSVCEVIAEQIRRHVDGVARNGVDVRCDDKIVCEHCGADWTEEGNYNGGCCAKDIENEPKEQIT